tara:strand:- start:266 stop:2062 length:1797 start_codon:yes stop_codon:yes gene_type:complete
MPQRITPIKYTARDFSSIKQELVSYAKRYYPETFRDFNEASFGALMLDMVSYIGDNLSFYLDYQANESFFDTATERSNLIRHAKQMGYKFRGSPSSVGVCDFFIVVPANSTGLGPDTSYLPILKTGTEVASTAGTNFILTENINFADSTNPVVAARVNDTTGLPTSYAVKSSGKVTSGSFKVERHSVGAFQRFLRIRLKSSQIVEILSIFDDQGHEYVGVDYLSQNVVYKEMSNRGTSASDQAASVMKPVMVPRRFVVEQDGSSVYIQFGYGSDSEVTTDSIAEPSQMVFNMSARSFIEETSFDPSKMLDTDKFGIAPSDTTLTITYRVNNSRNVNAASNTVNSVISPITEFPVSQTLSQSTVNAVVRSIECNNESPVVGGLSRPSMEEIRRRAIDHFATQNRAVTRQDYESIAYSMPPQFGAIKRCKITKDSDSFKRNLNMYVLAENRNQTLTLASGVLKDNLKTWLGKYKMIHDTIDIIDGRVINFGINYGIIADPNFNKFEVLEACNSALVGLYRYPGYFGEFLYITDVYSVLNKIDGVVDTYDVSFIQKQGGVYSDTTYNFAKNMSADGRYLIVPDNVCMELKYGTKDIQGAIK